MRCLWAVWRLREDIGWFLENDYVEARKARALRHLFETLCSETANFGVDFVDAFGIPDAMLGPIAFEGYANHPALD
jgi:hypothetical protein